MGPVNGLLPLLETLRAARVPCHPLCPAGAVDTSVPTAPTKQFGYVIEYGVADAAGNRAPTARRLINVTCPANEAYCVDPGTGGLLQRAGLEISLAHTEPWLHC